MTKVGLLSQRHKQGVARGVKQVDQLLPFKKLFQEPTLIRTTHINLDMNI